MTINAWKPSASAAAIDGKCHVLLKDETADEDYAGTSTADAATYYALPGDKLWGLK